MAEADPVAISGVGDSAFAAAHARLRADSAIQFDLPVAQPPKVPEWLKLLSRFLRDHGTGLTWVGWGVVALVVLLLLLLVAQRLLGVDFSFLRRRRAQAQEEAPDWRPEVAPARRLLAEADALAAAGRFAEAAHLLLLRGIEEIGRRRPAFLRPALTSRDIAGSDALPDRARRTFASIAATVERSLFGGREVDAAGWQTARAAYEDFAFPDAWR